MSHTSDSECPVCNWLFESDLRSGIEDLMAHHKFRRPQYLLNLMDQVGAVEATRTLVSRTELSAHRSSAPLTFRRRFIQHLSNTRGRQRSFAQVWTPPLTREYRPPPFVHMRRKRICKQGVVGSSPIVSTRCHFHNVLPGRWPVLASLCQPSQMPLFKPSTVS